MTDPQPIDGVSFTQGIHPEFYKPISQVQKSSQTKQARAQHNCSCLNPDPSFDAFEEMWRVINKAPS